MNQRREVSLGVVTCIALHYILFVLLHLNLRDPIVERETHTHLLSRLLVYRHHYMSLIISCCFLSASSVLFFGGDIYCFCFCIFIHSLLPCLSLSSIRVCIYDIHSFITILFFNYYFCLYTIQ